MRACVRACVPQIRKVSLKNSNLAPVVSPPIETAVGILRGDERAGSLSDLRREIDREKE